MNKAIWLILIILIFAAGSLAFVFLGDQISIPRLGPAKEEVATVGGEIETAPIATSASEVKTRYTNEEFGFSLSYPAGWRIPVEGRIEPPRQHLYQIALNPGTEAQFLVDIYDQPSPIPLSSFVEGFFADIEDGPSEIVETTINDNEAIKFFMAKLGLTSQGAGKTGFRKGAYIVIISTPLIKGSASAVLADETLSALSESFEWVE